MLSRRPTRLRTADRRPATEARLAPCSTKVHWFHGRSFEINRPIVRDLDRTSFNDRAQSLRVYSGYGMFCSDANFEGQCRTFGPENTRIYGRLERRRILSGRKISDRYPYAGHSDWAVKAKHRE